jgi:hypothetical protein
VGLCGNILLELCKCDSDAVTVLINVWKSVGSPVTRLEKDRDQTANYRKLSRPTKTLIAAVYGSLRSRPRKNQLNRSKTGLLFIYTNQGGVGQGGTGIGMPDVIPVS